MSGKLFQLAALAVSLCAIALTCVPAVGQTASSYPNRAIRMLARTAAPTALVGKNQLNCA